MPTPINLPYPVGVTLYDTDGTTLVGSATVTLRNETTGERVTQVTNSAGQAVLDAGNLASGYLNTDRITLYVYYTNAYVETTILISDDVHQATLTLVSITDSYLINYTTVQKVWDSLDGLGASDISAQRIITAVQWAEDEIDRRTGTKWTSTTETQEIYDWNQYTTYKSAEAEGWVGRFGRTDSWYDFSTDTLRLNKHPIISVTTLQKNAASENATDSWTTLDEQTGTGGDYIIYKKQGVIRFVKNYPRSGKRSVRVTYAYGYSTVPKTVERLATLLAIRDVIRSKAANSQFSSIDNIEIEGIRITKSVSQTMSYLKEMNEEIERLFHTVGDFVVEGIGRVST